MFFNSVRRLASGLIRDDDLGTHTIVLTTRLPWLCQKGERDNECRALTASSYPISNPELHGQHRSAGHALVEHDIEWALAVATCSRGLIRHSEAMQHTRSGRAQKPVLLKKMVRDALDVMLAIARRFGVKVDGLPLNRRP